MSLSLDSESVVTTFALMLDSSIEECFTKKHLPVSFVPAMLQIYNNFIHRYQN